MGELASTRRMAEGQADGLLVLHHGRGSSEHDLIQLADVLDPERRLHVVSPGGPLSLAGWPGRHWYVVREVGFPDPPTFREAQTALAGFHDDLWEQTGIGPERTILGGFSMGAVMSWATALDPDRPAVAGILAMSGFVPTVEGWDPDFAAHRSTRALVCHGRNDGVIEVGFGRRARDLALAGGIDCEYLEGDGEHSVDPGWIGLIQGWISATVPTVE